MKKTACENTPDCCDQLLPSRRDHFELCSVPIAPVRGSQKQSVPVPNPLSMEIEHQPLFRCFLGIAYLDVLKVTPHAGTV